MENTHGHTALRRLAQWHGIQRVFTDEGGNRRVVSDEILKKILGLLDIPVTTPQEIQAALRETQDHHWTQLAEDTLVIPTSQLEKGWTLRLPLGPIPHSKLRVHWDIQKESGQKHSSHILAGSRLDLQATKQLNGLRYVRFGLPFPKRLKSGYFTLRFHASTPQQSWKGSTNLIVTPQTCFSPSPRSRSRRLWGITLQLYGLRSTKNWGRGDFQDLKDFMTWAGKELGAAMVGVNPLHVLMMTLKRAGSLPRGFSINTSSDPHLTPELRVAIMTFLARTPSFLLAISLEDLLGDLESPNIPGASPTKYPVWRTKAGPPASTLQTWRNVQDLKFLTQALNKERGFARRRKNP